MKKIFIGALLLLSIQTFAQENQSIFSKSVNIASYDDDDDDDDDNSPAAPIEQYIGILLLAGCMYGYKNLTKN